MVVFCHVWAFCFFGPENNLETRVFGYVMLPAFFLVSGFFSKITFDWLSIFNRLQFVLLPTIIIYSIYTLLVKQSLSSLWFEWNTEYKFGYWFPFTLVIMNLLHAISSNSIKQIRAYRENLTIGILIVISVLLIILKDWDWNHNEATLCQSVSLRLIAQYFPLYILGVILKRWQLPLFRLFENKVVAVLILALFVYACFWTNIGFYKGQIASILGALSLLVVIHGFQNLFSSTTYLGKQLMIIGRKTLQIYLLHYFFLLPVKISYPELFEGSRVWGASIIVSFVTIIVVYLSLGVDWMISRLEPVHKVLLGK